MAKLSNIVYVVHRALQHLSVKHTTLGLKEKLEGHPEYPSLLAIVDVYNKWGVANQASQLQPAQLNAEEMLTPFIAHFKSEGGRFVVVTAFEGERVVYDDDYGNGQYMEREQFLKHWTGIVLEAEADENSGEPDYKTQLIKSILNRTRLPIAVSVFVLLGFYALAGHFSLGTLSLFVLKMCGVGTCSLLLAQSLDANNPLVQQLCGLGRKNNCNAILKSDVSKITSWLSWSEVGFFYFAGSLLVLILSPGALPVLAWLNLLALPYTVFSVAYQALKKNWCVLCCAVQAILVLEALNNIVFSEYVLPNFHSLPLTIGLFLVPILAWANLKTVFQQKIQARSLRLQLKKFKYNSKLFKQALTSQPKYAVGGELMPLVLGNPNGTTKITMVSNPFCGPCAKAHQTLDNWLKQRDDIQLSIVFTTADHDDDNKTKVARHLSALSLSNDVALVEKSLNDWYALQHKKYEDWAERYPVTLDEDLKDATTKQKAWCEMAEIAFTPTILVDGHKLPEPYRLEDIEYLLD